MSDDDGPTGPSRGGLLHGDEGEVPVRNEGPSTRWRTLSLAVPLEEAQRLLREALSSVGPRDLVVGSSQLSRGFVIHFRNGRRSCAAEVEFLAWDGGTRIQLALPAEQKAKDLDVLTAWLRAALGADAEP